ncbi:hypothetical protein [Brevibacillus migulae]|uniref:hypothetical protein n=1 Tax=Brevibacillus migulae TaxID=1644114 RepID=UPI00106E49AA|nr:hypothetical protein [Brevibacillus migulae]
MTVTGMIHSTAAVFIIACIVLPFFAMGFGKLSAAQAAERARKLTVFLRIPNFILLVSLITGLMQSGWVFSTWLLMVIIVFLAIGAMIGIASKTLKTIQSDAQAGRDYQASIKKLQVVSILLTIFIIIMVIIKVS